MEYNDGPLKLMAAPPMASLVVPPAEVGSRTAAGAPARAIPPRENVIKGIFSVGIHDGNISGPPPKKNSSWGSESRGAGEHGRRDRAGEREPVLAVPENVIRGHEDNVILSTGIRSQL